MLACADSLDEHRPQTVEQIVEQHVLVPPLRQHLVHRGDRQDPVHGVLQRLARVDSVGRARL